MSLTSKWRPSWSSSFELNLWLWMSWSWELWMVEAESEALSLLLRDSFLCLFTLLATMAAISQVFNRLKIISPCSFALHLNSIMFLHSSIAFRQFGFESWFNTVVISFKCLIHPKPYGKTFVEINSMHQFIFPRGYFQNWAVLFSFQERGFHHGKNAPFFQCHSLHGQKQGLM